MTFVTSKCKTECVIAARLGCTISKAPSNAAFFWIINLCSPPYPKIHLSTGDNYTFFQGRNIWQTQQERRSCLLNFCTGLQVTQKAAIQMLKTYFKKIRVALHFAKSKEGRDADINMKFPVDQTGRAPWSS